MTVRKVLSSARSILPILNVGETCTSSPPSREAWVFQARAAAAGAPALSHHTGEAEWLPSHINVPNKCKNN